MSKFKNVLDAAKSRELPVEIDMPAPLTVDAKASEPDAPRRGRPPGKRSSSEYTQVTAYVKSATYRNVKIALLTDNTEQDFSELLEGLMTRWLESRT